VGLLNWLYEAVAWVIMQIHGVLSHVFGAASGWSWALSIILLTMLVRLLIFPLFVKQIHSQRKMGELAPKVSELRKKYKNDKQKMNEEVMKLYRENGANPLGGCLPLIAQLPVFISLFTVLRAIANDQPKYGLTPAVVASAQHAEIFGVTVASRFLTTLFPPHMAPNPLNVRVVIVIAVLLSGATTYLTVRQSTRRTMVQMADNPVAQQQKMMAYIAPLFALSGLYWQFGLVLYWLTSNLWTLAQQHYIFSKYPQPGTAAVAATGSAGGGSGPAGGTGGARRTRATSDGQTGGTGGGKRPAAGGPAAGKHPQADGAGDGQSRPGLSRLLRSRSAQEPEPPPEAGPKLVRQQPVRQSRSKRSGKR
jgi:YidC/Oxa1 family membrane protein insertase